MEYQRQLPQDRPFEIDAPGAIRRQATCDVPPIRAHDHFLCDAGGDATPADAIIEITNTAGQSPSSPSQHRRQRSRAVNAADLAIAFQFRNSDAQPPKPAQNLKLLDYLDLVEALRAPPYIVPIQQKGKERKEQK